MFFPGLENIKENNQESTTGNVPTARASCEPREKSPTKEYCECRDSSIPYYMCGTDCWWRHFERSVQTGSLILSFIHSFIASAPHVL